MSENFDIGGEGFGSRPRPQHKPERPTPKIPIETFLEAQRDPKLWKFLDEARIESQELKRKGLLHL